MKRTPLQRHTPMSRDLRKDDGNARLDVPVLRKKRCAKTKGGCGEYFRPMRPMQSACSPGCAQAMGRLKNARAERKADRTKREKLKTRAQWAAEAQASFNAWIRARDADLPCVSCGRFHDGKWNAGHYLSRGARPELRYEPSNVHKQCEPCNSFLSGNVVLYRAELIRRIGLQAVEWLEGPHEPVKLSIDDFREIRDRYRRLKREIERQRDASE